MRLKQATVEVAPSMQQTPTLQQREGQDATSQTQKASAATSLAGARTTPVGTAATATQQAKRNTAFLPSSDVLKISLLGLLVGVLACGLFLCQIPFTNGIPHRALILDFCKLITFLLLSVSFSFGLGWQQRNGIRGALSGVVFGITIIAGFLACLAIVPSLLPVQPIDSLHLTPFYVLLFVVVMGALGGVCGRSSQARRARRGKANR